ncbi:MAG: thiamine-phosphate kinase [Sphingomicrobium sp.]
MNERDVIARLRRSATHPAARGLLDDVALLDGLVITHDSIAEGVHFRADDPPASVGWKLMAVNLSDLAAKGARPAGALLSLTLAGDDDWEEQFLGGTQEAAELFGMPIIGGDTISLPAGAPRVLGLTAIGRAGSRTPDRSGARPGDALWVVGTLGDSAAGLAMLQEDGDATGALVDSYRRPVPRLEAGETLAPHALASMDISDGLLLDASRMAEASGCTAHIDLDQLPLSEEFIDERGSDLAARLFAATGGDDYALLFAFPPELDPFTLSLPSGTTMARVGMFVEGGAKVALTSGGQSIPLPESLGYEHRTIASPMGDRH